MAPHRIHSRGLTVVERINVLEGEDCITDSDNDLDMPHNRSKVNLAKYLDSDNDAVTVSSGDDDDDNSKRQKNSAPGIRVAFSDGEDSDTVYKEFKSRKSKQTKQAAAERKALKDSLAKAKAQKGSLIGRRAPKKPVAKERVWGDASDDEGALMETTLPEALQQRKAAWAKRIEKYGENGLRIPPNAQDVYFTEDEDLTEVPERPVLIQKPRNEHKDIFMPISAGRIPAPTAQYLRDYQIEGAKFMHYLFVYQQGGILGDDMGLGKTIQVIAFLTAAFGKVGDRRDFKRMRRMRRMEDSRWYPRVLLVCPGSLMANWTLELNTWGWWHISMYHGTSKEREATLAAVQAGRLEIMITTYDTYRTHENAINSVRWDCVIADECHIIKEKKAKVTQAMNNVNALCRIGLTGTAIQNKYEELWTLLNWTNPGRFGPLFSWKQLICNPLKVGQSHDATVGQIAKARKTATKLVSNILPRVFLRRTKALIAHEMPKKSDRVVFCPLTRKQSDAYNNFCDTEIMLAIRHATDMCDCGSGKKQGWCCGEFVDGEKWQNFVFPALTLLRNLSNHIALLVPEGETQGEKQERALEKLKMVMPEDWRRMYNERESLTFKSDKSLCGKWKILKDLMLHWRREGDKVLVFSHSVQLLKLLRLLINVDSNFGDCISYLDGNLKYSDRQEEVDSFNSDPRKFAFLISSRAGGVGLNIVSANKVVVVDPHWNPSYDLQAQDRAYRIGQKRDVEVFRLVSVGTIEEIVYARQIYKQQQANIGYNASVERRYFKGVQGQKDQKGEIFGLINLFAPHSENIVLQDIVNKTNIAESKAGFQIAGLEQELGPDDPESDSGSDDLSQDPFSQLAAEVTGEARARPGSRGKSTAAKKSDPVAAILASAGVQYTHENSEVIGTSKIETKISSRATKSGNDVDYANEVAFGQVSASQSSIIEQGASGAGMQRHRDEMGYGESNVQGDGDVDVGMVYGDQAHKKSRTYRRGDKIRYTYKPPADVRHRQLCEMARWKGYDDPVMFARVMEERTQAERRDFLEGFYEWRKKKLFGEI